MFEADWISYRHLVLKSLVLRKVIFIHDKFIIRMLFQSEKPKYERTGNKCYYY